jgi:hypothetical protein
MKRIFGFVLFRAIIKNIKDVIDFLKSVFEALFNFIRNNIEIILIILLAYTVLIIIGYILQKREKNKKLANENYGMKGKGNLLFGKQRVNRIVIDRKIKKKRANVLITNIDLKSKTDIQKFVKKWKKFYRYPRENLYKNNIQKSKFDEGDLINLYIWKNGGNLSELKRTSLTENIIRKLDVINELKSDFDIDKFESEFKDVSAIWKIYLLHLIAPGDYPIFDQHVCRAYYYIEKKKIEEIPQNNRNKEEIYFHEYLHFFNRLAAEGIDRKELDEALWAFGKYLKDKNCLKYQKM